MISVLVQHHPARADLLPRITSALPGARPVVDPDPDGPPSTWRTYQRCLQEAALIDGPVLIVQDDAVPLPGLAGVLDQIAAAWPHALVSLYTGHQPGRTARLVQAAAAGSYVPVHTGQWCPLVATIWPHSLATVACRVTAPLRRADDYVVGHWTHSQQVKVVATCPSLVDHPDDQPSLIGKRWGTTWRQAIRPLVGDAGSLDWSHGQVTVPGSTLQVT